MYTVHFYENRTPVLSQLLNNVPSINDSIKIKGRKGTIVDVQKVEDTQYHVLVVFEKVNKKRDIAIDSKKKRK